MSDYKPAPEGPALSPPVEQIPVAPPAGPPPSQPPAGYPAQQQQPVQGYYPQQPVYQQVSSRAHIECIRLWEASLSPTFIQLSASG